MGLQHDAAYHGAEIRAEFCIVLQSAIGLVADDMISRCLSKKRKHTYVLWILRAGEREKVQGKLG